METITVYNSTRRSWAMVLLGAAMTVVALDLLVWNALVAGLAERVYQGEEILEARERVWAAMLGVGGAALMLWGISSGLRFRPVLTVGPEGLSIALRGPFRPRDTLEWESISQLISQPVKDDGALLPSLTIVLDSGMAASGLPSQPWGARWTGKRILRVLSSDWSERAEVVAAVGSYFSDRRPEGKPTEGG